MNGLDQTTVVVVSDDDVFAKLFFVQNYLNVVV